MYRKIFTDEWAQAYGEHINKSMEFATAAKGWNISLVLRMIQGQVNEITDSAVYLEIQDGICTVQRAATQTDCLTARLVISADVTTWEKILKGDIYIYYGLMWGKISLERGDLFTVARNLSALTRLIKAAASVPMLFPEE
jgi:putative sterol carrier protein